MDDQTRANASLDAHLRGLLDKRLTRLIECRRFATKSSPAEALHDLRVASRRLRAFGDVFRDSMGKKTHARLDGPLRRITRAAGKVRDYDIQIGLVEARLPECASDTYRATLEYLLEYLADEQTRAAAKAERRLGKIDFGALTTAVRAAREEVILRLPESGPKTRAFAQQLLERLVSDAARPVPPEDGAEHPEKMHRLRVSVKKLRYALELFEPALGSEFESVYGRASALQDLLGSHHDLVVLANVVEKRRRHLEEAQRHVLSGGMKMLSDALSSARASLLTRYRGERFDEVWWRTAIRRVTTEDARIGDSPHVRNG